MNQHFDHWVMEEKRFHALYSLIMSENITFEEPKAGAMDDMAEEFGGVDTKMTSGGIMVIPIEGTIMRAQSSYGGTSSVQVRQILRNAAQDPKVKGVMLAIDSPGGTVAGTDELAAEIKAFSAIKPIHSHVGALMASAAYWTGAQADRITAVRTAEVGSLGTVATVHDMSEAAAKEGIKVHVISTGDHKGAFTPGSEVTEAQLADLQKTVDTLNGFFMEAVSEARGFSAEKTAELFDGRVHVAHDAVEMGLIDGISTFENAIRALENEVSSESTADQEAELAMRMRRRI